jgi:carbon-monoxide dehydrogenase medium subunit
MVLPKFDYHSPTSLDDAVSWLAERYREGVNILGGGTDLLVGLRGKVIPDGHRPRCQEHRSGPWHARHKTAPPPRWLLALSRIPELLGIQVDGSHIRIGAMTTHTELERSPIIAEHLPGLRDGAMQLGSPLCRNRGTYGGNLCNARPAADTAIPTLALDGKLALVSVRGERTMALSDFITGSGQTAIQPDEILKEIRFDLSPLERDGLIRSSAYIKLSNRKALEIAVVSAAAALTFKDGAVASARIALGAVAPYPLLVKDVGESLTGQPLSKDTINRAAEIAAATARPITDHRGGAEYRKVMVAVLVRRVLNRCRERALAIAGGEVAL